MDGLRGIAILAVLAFHLRLPFVSGGYLGVSLFFTVSGFVVARSTMRSGSFDAAGLARFWSRRLRRIAPAAAVTLLAVFAGQYLGFWALETSELADEALAAGLVSQVTPAGGAVDGALEWAERIAANAPLAVAASKQLIKAAAGSTPDEFYELQGPLMGTVFTSNDAKEGPKAFAEKRAPEWTGT